MEDTQFKQLFKIDSQGRLRTWWVEIYDDHFTTNAGLVGGRIVQKRYDSSKVKPKGKKTFKEQLYSEAKSKWNAKKNRELYQTDSKCSAAPDFTKPMLALDYTKASAKRIKEVWDGTRRWGVQAKLNGVRCTAKLKDGKVILTSRKGKEYTVDHIQRALLDLYENNPMVDSTIEFDGELYIHGVELGDVTHAVSNNDLMLDFMVFDITKKDTQFHLRDTYLSVLKLQTPLFKVNTILIDTEAQLISFHDNFVSNGYEGIILRDLDGQYKFGAKTPAMFKYKKFQDSEFEAVDVIPDKEGGARLVLQTAKGVKFNSRPMGTNEYRQKLLADKANIIGKQVTVRYSNLLASGVPEFNRVVAIRDYE